MVDDCRDSARDRSAPIRNGEPNIGAAVSYPRPLAIEGLSGHATTEDHVMFARKAVFPSIGRACAVATVVAGVVSDRGAALEVVAGSPSCARGYGAALLQDARDPPCPPTMHRAFGPV